MVLFAITVIFVTAALVSITCTRRKLNSPEVENDVNPGIPFINQNRFNPSIARSNILAGVLLFMLFMFGVIYKADSAPDLTEILSPTGLKINMLAFYSLSSTMIYPVSIYLTHKEARNHLRRMVNHLFPTLAAFGSSLPPPLGG